MNPRSPKQKAIFLDRDGTLIVDKVYLNDPDAIEYLPGVFEALRELRDAGFVFFVVTNQSGVPRGLVEIKNLNEIHRRMRAEFSKQGVDFLEFYYAPYLTDHDHIYRKPNPGMLLQASVEYNIDLGASWILGDRMTDVEAGHRAGAYSILIEDDAPGAKKYIEKEEYLPATGVFKSVLAATPFIIKQDSQHSKQDQK